jgi:hypothetical protein
MTCSITLPKHKSISESTICHSLPYVQANFFFFFKKKKKHSLNSLYLINTQGLLQCFPMCREPKVVPNTLF